MELQALGQESRKCVLNVMKFGQFVGAKFIASIFSFLGQRETSIPRDSSSIPQNSEKYYFLSHNFNPRLRRIKATNLIYYYYYYK